MAEQLCTQVLDTLSSHSSLDTAAIQDCVETTLMQAGYLATARASIIFREQRVQARRDRATAVDVASAMDEYLTREDWRVRANANQGYSSAA